MSSANFILDVLKRRRKEEILMLVKATNKYKELNIKDNILNRIPEKGEEFEVTEERFKVLTETNQYNVVFVEKVEEKETEDKNTNINNIKKNNTRKKKKEC